MKTRTLLTTVGSLLLVAQAFAQTVDSVALTDLYEPYGVAVSTSTNRYYFTDSANSRIIAVSAGSTKSLVLADRLLAGPQGIVYTPRGLVVSESVANRLSLVSLEGDVSTVAGGSRGAANGRGLSAQFNAPAGLAVDASGNIFVADVKNNSIRKVTTEGDVTTYAQGFFEPAAVAVGEGTAVFVADTRNHEIKLIPSPGASPLTIAGRNRAQGSDDGVGETARFNNPRGLLWVGGETGLLVSDTGNNTIRKISNKTGVWRVQTLAGKAGDSGKVDGEWLSSRFNGPMGLTLDLDGHILVADLFNNGLRLLKREPVVLPEVTPSSGSYSNALSLTLKTATPSTTFYYTTNGAEPYKNALTSTGGLTLSGGPIPFQVRGFTPDHSGSLTISNWYTFFVNPPIMVPAGGSFSNNQEVAVSSATLTADLRYTLDGSIPTLSSPRWIDSTIASNTTLRIRGFRDGFEPSEVISNRFDFKVTDIAFQPAGGNYINETNISAKVATAGAEIRYTTDGSEPSLNSPIWSDRTILNGTVQLRAYKSGYTSSSIVSNVFKFVVDKPVITPSSLSSSDVVNVKVTSKTQGVKIFYTLDGTEPTTGTPTSVDGGGTIQVNRDGVLTVKAFKDGFEASEKVEGSYTLKVASPQIKTTARSASQPLLLDIASDTPGSKIYWTIDGSSPSATNGNFYDSTSKPALATSGTLKVRALRDGFESSDVVSADFVFTVAQPVITPPASTNLNSITISISSKTPLDGPGSGLFFTTDGTEPTEKSAQYLAPLLLTTNANIRVKGIRPGFTNSVESTALFRIKTPSPVMSPTSGYFPNGTKVSFTLAQVRDDAKIHYTLDGSEPTESSPVYSFPITVNQVVSSTRDLRAVRARAFSPNTLPSDIVSGQPVSENSIGIPNDLRGGIGSTIVVPVVLNLQSNTVLRSIQFRVEVNPDSASAKPLTSEIRALNVSSNDFITLAGSSVGGAPAIFSVSSYRSGSTSGLSVSAIGTNANFSVTDFGAVALLAISLPSDSKTGDTYKVRVIEPSGTTNAQQAKLELRSMDARTITVANVSYLVGDTSIGSWYNAGDFGDGVLDNSDVNNAFYASLGIRVPYPFSDAFDAMDAYPDDDAGAVGGDGQIRFLDWQRVLARSLKRDVRNWSRNWSDGGFRTTTAATLPASGLLPATTEFRTLSRSDSWVTQATIRGGNVGQVNPGAAVQVPVTLNVSKGSSIAGLQFRLKVDGPNRPLTTPVHFSPHKEIPSPLSADGLPSSETVVSWPLVPSALLTPALTSSKVVGYVTFTVPTDALVGDIYSVRFTHVDASPDLDTQYELDSVPGRVWVGSAVPNEIDQISDEWRKHYFGDISDSRALASFDADGDGANNFSEFVAGTNPVKSSSRFEMNLSNEVLPGGRSMSTLKWQSVAGRSYHLESANSVSGSVWQSISDPLAGNGEILEFSAPTSDAGTTFYRIKVLVDR